MRCGLWIGAGLLKVKKWAVLLLFVPAILCLAVFTYGWMMGARALMPWAILNYVFIAVLFVVPTLMLWHWSELRW